MARTGKINLTVSDGILDEMTDVLLRAGVDIVTISQWLGHSSVTTTNRYAMVDLEMKRQAIEQAQAVDRATSGELTLWRTDS